MPINYGYDMGFNQTSTSIIATNDRVATLIMQTQVAATEQFNATNTPLP
jgi:hypothetical protein